MTRTIYTPYLRQPHFRLEPPLQHCPQCQSDDAHIAIEHNGTVPHLRNNCKTARQCWTTSVLRQATNFVRPCHAAERRKHPHVTRMIIFMHWWAPAGVTRVSVTCSGIWLTPGCSIAAMFAHLVDVVIPCLRLAASLALGPVVRDIRSIVPCHSCDKHQCGCNPERPVSAFQSAPSGSSS